MATGSTYEKTAIGRRIARYRQEAGFSNAAALADAIESSSITRSTIVNLELGRKADVSIRDVILIANACEISPLALILDLEQPFAQCDVPEFAGHTVEEAAELFQMRDYSMPRTRRSWLTTKTLHDIWANVAEVNAQRVHRAQITDEIRRIEAEFDRMEGDKEEYQQTSGIDVSEDHYRGLQDELKQASHRIAEIVDWFGRHDVEVPPAKLAWLFSTEIANASPAS